MVVVAVGVAERVLHVADQRVEPVDDVQRAVGAELDVDRAEVRVGRLAAAARRLVGREARAVLLHLVAADALEADAVVEQEVALGLGREVAAADQLAAAGGPPLLGEELLHRRRACRG